MLWSVVAAPVLGQPSPSGHLGTPAVITERGPHHRVWERQVAHVNAAERTVTRTSRVVEIGTGLHYWTGDRWVESRDEIEIVDGQAVFRQAPIRAAFAANLNSSGAIELVDRTGRRFRSHPLAVLYTDFHQRGVSRRDHERVRTRHHSPSHQPADYGILLESGSRLISQGWAGRMNRLVRIHAVQEGPAAAGTDYAILADASQPATPPEAHFRFTDFPQMSGSSLWLDPEGDSALQNLTHQDCQFRGGRFWWGAGAGTAVVGFTNNLFESNFVATTNGVPIDVDADGLPDYLEDLNGDGVADSNEASWDDNDTDGDGVSDYVEWLQGRNGLVSGTVSDTNNVLRFQVFTPLK